MVFLTNMVDNFVQFIDYEFEMLISGCDFIEITFLNSLLYRQDVRKVTQ